MRKTICLLLILCLTLAALSGCAGTKESRTPESGSPVPAQTPTEPPAEAEAPEPDGPDAATEGQAFAAAMAAWLGGEETLFAEDRTLLCWDMAGWYAAREYRIHGHDLFPADRIEDFLRSVGYTGPFELPEGWEEYGVAARLTAPDGTAYYTFGQHCREIDAMLGVDTEVNITTIDENTIEAAAISHYENGAWEKHSVTLSFEPNTDPGSAFPRRLTNIVPAPRAAETEGELTFTWEELLAANRLGNVLSIYPAVRHFEREYNPDTVTWVYPRGEGLTILDITDGHVSGRINGAYFFWDLREDGRMLASIESFDESLTDPGMQDDHLVNYLDNIVYMRYERTEGDLIWTECTGRGGFRERVAVDRGTLVLREVQFYYSDDLPPSTTVFLYDETAPALECLDSWDGPMRKVTVHWEDFTSGKRVAWDEERTIPADWEYLPWQARWGDYTVWMDEGYTKPYAYPGDGADYTLYLSTAKG